MPRSPTPISDFFGTDRVILIAGKLFILEQFPRRVRLIGYPTYGDQLPPQYYHITFGNGTKALYMPFLPKPSFCSSPEAIPNPAWHQIESARRHYSGLEGEQPEQYLKQRVRSSQPPKLHSKQTHSLQRQDARAKDLEVAGLDAAPVLDASPSVTGADLLSRGGAWHKIWGRMEVAKWKKVSGRSKEWRRCWYSQATKVCFPVTTPTRCVSAPGITFQSSLIGIPINLLKKDKGFQLRRRLRPCQKPRGDDGILFDRLIEETLSSGFERILHMDR